MKLHIENIAKIANADIRLDGLTVLAGDNNTGKSTIGKVLYSLFDIHSSMDERIQRARRRYVLNSDRLPRIPKLDVDALLADTKLSEQTLFELLRKHEDIFPLWLFASDVPKTNGSPSEDEWLRQLAQELHSRILQSRAIPSDKLCLGVWVEELARNFYVPVFALPSAGAGVAKIVLEIQGNVLELSITDHSFNAQSSLSLFRKAWFVGSPDLLNAVSRDRMNGLEHVHVSLLKKIREQRENDALNTLLVNEKLKDVLARLQGISPGRFKLAQDGKTLLMQSVEFPEGLPVEVLSMGLKTFALLRLMLERGVLQEGDVLVLDEPENNLHPKWQLVYAEIIVLLQKAFGLTVLLTTHSPYFMDAIRLFSAEHGSRKNLSIYSSRCLDGEAPLVEFLDISQDNDALHRPFSVPLRELRNMAGEVE